MVKFEANWCKLCKAMKPKFNRLAKRCVRPLHRDYDRSALRLCLSMCAASESGQNFTKWLAL